jgi:hypothetical protein
MFELALQSYERSSACVRGTRLSGMPLLVGLFCLYNTSLLTFAYTSDLPV